MKTYNKRPFTYKELVELLKQRGMTIPNEKRAERLLANISYYRLSAYMLPFKKRTEEGVPYDEFLPGTSWNDIYALYIFDRKLRLLVFDAIERLEVSIRSQIINQLSLKYGSHWQDIPEIFNPPITKTKRDGRSVTFDVYTDIQNHIKEQLRNNRAEVFIQHYHANYDNPENPPSWMSVEIMYFSHLSRICSGLKSRADINGIAKYYALPPDTFCSWLHTLNYVRNICAHHFRLWNRDLNIVPEKLSFSKSLVWISNPNTVKRSKTYHLFCMLMYMLQVANPSSSFGKRLKALLKEYEDVISVGAMGFPEDWEKEKIWEN